MATRLIGRQYKLSDSSLDQGSDTMGSQRDQIVWLLGLAGIVLSILVIAALAVPDRSPASQADHVQSSPTESAQMSAVEPGQGEVVAPVESIRTDTQSSEPSNLSNHTTVINGQAQVEVEINGREIPVASQGATHQTFTDSTGQTQIDVNIQNGQASSMTSTSGTGQVNSFSHSFQSTYINGSTP